VYKIVFYLSVESLFLVMILSEDFEKEKFLIAEMTWPEVKEALAETDMAMVSVSSTEQHGPHLPVKTDAVVGYEVCKRAAARLYRETGIRVLIAPPLHIGMSLHHMSFPGTIALKPETLKNVITEVCWCLSEHGFKKIVVVNSHGGNRTVLDAAARKIFDNTDAMVFFTSTSIAYVDEEMNEAKKVLKAGPGGSCHAGETETSIMLALSEHVRVERIPDKPIPPRFPLPEYVGWGTAKYTGVNFTGNWNTEQLSEDGYLGDPSKASKETGEKILDYRVKNLVEFLKQFSDMEVSSWLSHQPP